MKVVFLEDVEGVALGGDVKEVKNGFAKNYLIPSKLAAPATHNNLQMIKKLSSQADVTRIRQLEDMKELAEAIEGTEINMEMRAGANNRLYGSVTGTMVADAVIESTGHIIERRMVQLDDPIREVGVYDVPIRLHPEAIAAVKVSVYATGTDPLGVEESSNANDIDHDSTGEEAQAIPSRSVAIDPMAVVDSGDEDEVSSENEPNYQADVGTTSGPDFQNNAPTSAEYKD